MSEAISEVRRLSFRPFRRVGDKLVVTAYTGWRSVFTANYQGGIVKLLPFADVKPGEVIYNDRRNHDYGNVERFEALFWPIESAIFRPIVNGVRVPREFYTDDMVEPFDCDGCPTFSHQNALHVANFWETSHLFDLLTAEIVYAEFEIMRDTLTKITWTR